MKHIKLTDSDIKNQVHDIVRAIIFSKWAPDYIVGISPSGLTPSLMISTYFNIPLFTLEQNCSSCGFAEDAFGYNNKNSQNILIVDNFNNSGNTFQWIINDWQQICLPHDNRWKSVWHKNVRFASLVNNSDSNFLEVDYSALEIYDESVSFPWNTWWEN
jgi:hypoxanthine phosphoribosyltransferase